MTGYRVGWVAGDKRIVSLFKKLKTNIDSGTPDFIQAAAIAALHNEKHAQSMRVEYKEKRAIMLEALREAGLPPCTSEATFYLWQKVPTGMDSIAFAKKLLSPELALVTTPGSWISDTTDEGINPGERFVRFALVPPLAEVKEAAERIKKYLRFPYF